MFWDNLSEPKRRHEAEVRKGVQGLSFWQQKDFWSCPTGEGRLKWVLKS